MNPVQRIDAILAANGGFGVEFTARELAELVSRDIGFRVFTPLVSRWLQQHTRTRSTLYTLDCQGYGPDATWVARPPHEWNEAADNAALKGARRVRNDLDRRVRPLVMQIFAEIDAVAKLDDLNAAVDLMLEEVERILRQANSNN